MIIKGDLKSIDELNISSQKSADKLTEGQENRKFITQFKTSLLKSKTKTDWIYELSHLKKYISNLKRITMINYVSC